MEMTILKFRNEDGMPCPIRHRQLFTLELCETIATVNGKLNTMEVHETLAKGLRVYTNFSYYVLE